MFWASCITLYHHTTIYGRTEERSAEHEEFRRFWYFEDVFYAKMGSDRNGDGLDGTSTPKIGLYVCKRVCGVL